MKSRGLLPVLMIVVSLILAACGGGGNKEGAKPAPESVDVVMHDIYYGNENTNATAPPTWSVNSGAEVTVKLTNQGVLQHNWAIVKPGQDVPEPYTGGEDNPDLLLINAGLLDAGATESATFTISEAGEYLVICTVAGHYPSMQGRLIVK